MSSPTGLPLQSSRPKRCLGQNFLVDPNIGRKIVASLDAGPLDAVVEIGPGRGALTRILCRSCGSVIGVEMDQDLAFQLRTCATNLRLIIADALTLDWSRLVRPGWKVIGNLPYNIASPLMWDMVAQVPSETRMVFLVQKEVAMRLTASEGSRSFGGLSVWVQSFTRARLAFKVGPNVFRPRPKVESAVVVLERRPTGQEPENPDRLSQLIKLCFQHRRKQLGTILKPVWNSQVQVWLEAQGLGTRVRPEQMTVSQFNTLASLIFA